MIAAIKAVIQIVLGPIDDQEIIPVGEVIGSKQPCILVDRRLVNFHVVGINCTIILHLYGYLLLPNPAGRKPNPEAREQYPGFF